MNVISLPSIDSFNQTQDRKFSINGMSEKSQYEVGSEKTSPVKQEEPVHKKKRVKTGCLTCRKRHRKCDEKHPTCLSCQQKGFNCVWPAKAGGFVNNSQEDYSLRGKRRARSRVGDRILTTIQQEKIPAILDPVDNNRQRSLSLGFIGHKNDNTKSSSASSILEMSKRSNSEFSGMTDSPMNMYQSNIQAHTPHPAQNISSISISSSNSHSSTTTPPSVNTTKLLTQYSDHLQAISLLPDNSSSKMDLPSLLNGDINYKPKLDVQLMRPQLHSHDSHSNISTSITDMSPRSTYKSHETPNSLDEFFLSIETETLMEHNDYNDLHNILRDFMYLKNNNKTTDVVDDEDLNNELLSLPDDIRTFEDLIDVHSSGVVNEPVMSESEKMKLTRDFVMVVAPTLEMFDKGQHFSRVIPRMAQDCPALMYSMMLYSAKHLERINPNQPRGRLVELYRYSLQELIPTIKTVTIDLKIVSACVVLCCFEMMSSSPLNWRRHLEGCFALFTSCDINGFSKDPLSRALFWTFARMDICSSIISEKPTIIPFKNWLPQGWSEYDLLQKFTDPQYGGDAGMYLNYMVFLCSRVMNLLYNDEKDIDLKFDVEWERLWDELKEWEANRPSDMLPIVSYFHNSSLLSNEDQTSLFPTVLYTNSPLISGNQMFHMAVILMMQNKPRLFKFPLSPNGNKYSMIHRSITSHARQIIGISVTNRDHGAWINMIQPFWVAGKLMGQEGEQKLILKTIKELEELTGWAIAWRGRDLVDYWNRNI